MWLCTIQVEYCSVHVYTVVSFWPNQEHVSCTVLRSISLKFFKIVLISSKCRKVGSSSIKCVSKYLEKMLNMSALLPDILGSVMFSFIPHNA